MRIRGKLLIVAGLAVFAGMAFYGSRQVSKAREEQAALRQQQAVLTGQLQQARLERDAATNALAAAREEAAALNSGQNTVELLRLRGEVGQLRRQLAVSEARASAPFGGLAQMLSDPAMRDSIRQRSLLRTQMLFSDLFKELKLTPEQAQKASQLFSESIMSAAEKLFAIPQGSASSEELSQIADGWQKDLEKQLDPVLGEKGSARVFQFYQELPAVAAVELLKGRLGAEQLTEDQNNRLRELVKAEPFDLTRGIAGIWEKDFWGSQSVIDQHVEQVEASNQHIVDQASSFLSPGQVENLSAVLSNSLSARLAQAAALIKRP